LTALGIFIEILGALLILLGVLGAARDVFESAPKRFTGTQLKVIELFLQVVLQLLKGPTWLIMIATGALLVYFGHQLSTGEWPFA
jgi:hypothetical protein